MPREGSWPSGGLRVILEYANRLSRHSREVELIYPMFRINETFDCIHHFIYLIEYALIKLSGKFKPAGWFKLSPGIRNKFVWRLENHHYDKNAIYIATAIHTAYSLDRYRIPETNKIYFIQDFENWDFTDRDVIRSYHLKMRKIVISNWLCELLRKNGETAKIVPNGFDFTCFKMSKAVEQRDRNKIICLYHNGERKDLKTAITALNRVKSLVPDLEVTLFGVPERPELPAWYTYYQKPDRQLLTELYNEAAIYVGSSKIEGWGLTVGEAMCCGCAVACTNNKGYLEMARNEETALVSEVGDSDALANNIIGLIRDDHLRYKIAERGNQFIKKFNIEDSFKTFESIICSHI